MKKLLILLALLLVGCQAAMYGMAKDMDGVRLGMSHDEVIATMGRPQSTNVDGDRNEETLVYRKMVNATDMHPKVYSIVLRDNKVVRYGEQRATVEVYSR